MKQAIVIVVIGGIALLYQDQIRNIRGCQPFDHDHDHDHYHCKNVKSHYFDDLVAYNYITHVTIIFPPN